MIGEHIARFPSPSGHVFTSPGGGPVRHRNLHGPPLRGGGRSLRAPYRAPLPRSAPYRAAILIAQGWNPKQVQARLGHASVKTSLDCYGHLFDGHDAELLEGLDSVVRAGACPIRVQRVSKSFLREQKRPHKGPLTCMFV